MAFKMKGSPMQRNFGVGSPMKDDEGVLPTTKYSKTPEYKAYLQMRQERAAKHGAHAYASTSDFKGQKYFEDVIDVGKIEGQEGYLISTNRPTTTKTSGSEKKSKE